MFGLVGPALEVGGLGGEEPRLEATALVQCRPGQAFGEGIIVAGPGGDCPGIGGALRCHLRR